MMIVKNIAIKAYRKDADHTQCPPLKLIISLSIKVELKKAPDKIPRKTNLIINLFSLKMTDAPSVAQAAGDFPLGRLSRCSSASATAKLETRHKMHRAREYQPEYPDPQNKPLKRPKFDL